MIYGSSLAKQLHEKVSLIEETRNDSVLSEGTNEKIGYNKELQWYKKRTIHFFNGEIGPKSVNNSKRIL